MQRAHEVMGLRLSNRDCAGRARASSCTFGTQKMTAHTQCTRPHGSVSDQARLAHEHGLRQRTCSSPHLPGCKWAVRACTSLNEFAWFMWGPVASMPAATARLMIARQVCGCRCPAIASAHIVSTISSVISTVDRSSRQVASSSALKKRACTGCWRVLSDHARCCLTRLQS